MIEQQMLDFGGWAVRPHHRTTTLTTDWNTFKIVRELSEGQEYPAVFVNDIVSSARGGNSVEHHEIRRRSLLERQFKGGYRKVRLRCRMGVSLDCLMTEAPVGADDSCACVIRVKRDPKSFRRAACNA